MTRFSGIFRDVTLWAMPVDRIWDFAVRTDVLTRRGEGAEPEDWKLSVEGVEGECSCRQCTTAWRTLCFRGT